MINISSTVYRPPPPRSCVCDDSDGTQAVDLEQCDAGEEGYSEEFDCEGDSCKSFIVNRGTSVCSF